MIKIGPAKVRVSAETNVGERTRGGIPPFVRGGWFGDLPREIFLIYGCLYVSFYGFWMLFWSSMKAMTAPHLPRPICRARKPIFLDHEQVYISLFALGFAYYILAVAS